MADDRLYSTMWDIFSNVNQQLQFAETKNGALTTINFALVVAIGTILADHLDWSMNAKVAVIASALTLATAGITSLLSFLPFIGARYRNDHIDGPIGNSIYFMTISAMGERVFLARMKELVAAKTSSPLHADLANQITTNSRIARRKFTYFRLAGWVTLFGVAVPLVAYVISLLCGHSA